MLFAHVSVVYVGPDGKINCHNSNLSAICGVLFLAVLSHGHNYDESFFAQFAKESPERTKKIDKKPGFWDWLWSDGSEDQDSK